MSLKAGPAHTGTTPPRPANCSIDPPTVLTRPCPPTAQYRLTSAYANATIAAAYAAAVPTADQPEGAAADGARSTPVLPSQSSIGKRTANRGVRPRAVISIQPGIG